ncbi:unnamed protein product [Rotaria sp. Silwood2]|nr:unnamed protein product [Rotaria sp. Silwood2]CAF2550394.1 unnamed protein product [Rotaria sp. Silwood2]CAF2800869.1 unnamed protein product [Rotaria sp. Silwood2]
MSDEFSNFTTISCQKFKCSARGLLLPFGIEACMSIRVRAVLYFIFLLYLFLGIAIIADIFMSSIETITSRRRKIRYPDPGEKDKYLTVEVRIWNDTVANLTLMALGSSSPEILLSIIEIIGNRFEAGELGPGTTPPDHDETGSPRSFRKDELLQFLRDLGQTTNLSLEDKAQLFAAKLSESMHRSRMQYRIQGARMLTGGKSLFLNLPDKLQEIYERAVKPQPFDGCFSADHPFGGRKATLSKIEINDDPRMAVLEFASSSYAVLEREQRVTIEVVRYGLTNSVIHFRLDTIDGTATAGEDYVKLSEEFKMERGQQEKRITIHVIDDNQWEPDETFFVKLSLPEGEESRAKLGSKTIALVTIINDDEPGFIGFEESITLVKESVGKVEIKLLRVNGADGRVSVHYRTKDIDAVATRDYEPAQSEIIFEHGEISKIIAIPIMNDLEAEKDESFAVELYDPTGGAQLGKHTKTVVTIINDDDYKTMANRMASLVQVDMDKLSVTKTSWGQQFRDALNVNGGDLETAKMGHYIGHALAFFWKVLFAFVPPTAIAGGWLTFFVSLLFIALLTAVVGDVAAIFGCLVELKDSITAISFVALGTSLPDTFASMIAAKNSKTADDAIGNVTGSNSVNVFLGLGLPWLIAATYWESKNLPFTVKAGDLSFSVLVFSVCCVLSMSVLILRRYLGVFGKAELGGPAIPKYLCSIFFILLWIGYLTLSGLQAYGHIKWQS